MGERKRSLDTRRLRLPLNSALAVKQRRAGGTQNVAIL
jgi:hypothetical protein